MNQSNSNIEEFTRILKEACKGKVGLAKIQMQGELIEVICEFKPDGDIVPYAMVFTAEEQQSLREQIAQAKKRSLS